MVPLYMMEEGILLSKVRDKLYEGKQPSVVELLDNIDYSWTDYVPSIDGLMFANFIKEVNGGEEENVTPMVHMSMLDMVFSRTRRNLAMCSRGLGKTTLLGEYLFMYIMAFGKIPQFGSVPYALYIADSIENGAKDMRRNIEYRYTESEFMQSMVPNCKIHSITQAGNTETFHKLNPEEFDEAIAAGKKFTDIRMETINKRGDHFVLRLYGAKSGVRGRKELGQRPSLAIIDDVLDNDDARSPTVIASIEDTIYKSIAKALHPKRQKMIWLGTPFNENDPLVKAANSGAWNVRVFPICERFDSTMTKKEFVGAWEDRFPYEYVKAEYDEAQKLGRPSDFYQELMLRVSSDEDRLVPEKHITWYSRDTLLKNPYNFNWYITTDFAYSSSLRADFSVILVWAYTKNKDWLLADGWIGKEEFNVTRNKLFELVKKYEHNLMGVGLENSAQQKGIIDTIIDAQVNQNVFFNIGLPGDADGLWHRCLSLLCRAYRYGHAAGLC
jgi:hypothetical protein